MQGEGVGGRLATWVAGVLGVWAGLAALGALIAAMMFPQWAIVREPIVLAESPSRILDFTEDSLMEGDHTQGLQPIVTTVTFRLGLWIVCPRINTTNLHLLVGSPPCSSVSYTREHIAHQDLLLPAPAPLVQTVVARMRLSTPFMMLSCCLLAIGTFLAIIGRCCYAHASLVAALMYSLGGLSIGVAMVWFVSVISEEYGMASGRRTSWADMYAYRYGWSVMAAGAGGVAALLAALLTGHSHLARHAPLVTVLRARSSSTEESLARPLLRCRSEGCLGQRSFTSDTIRTYLTCDSRRHPQRGCPPLPLPHSPSIVDLTKPMEALTCLQEDPNQTQENLPTDTITSRRSSKVTIAGEDAKDSNQFHPQQQQQMHKQHPHPLQQHQSKQPQQQQQIQQQQQLKQQQQQLLQSSQQHLHNKIQHSVLNRSWSAETSQVVVEAQKGTVTKIVPPLLASQDLSPLATVPPPPPLSPSSSSPSPSPLEAPPPPLPPTSRAGFSIRTASGAGFRSTRESIGGLPEYNSFTEGSYSRTLPRNMPREGRQMAVFDRRSMSRSGSLSRSSSKISSEV